MAACAVAVQANYCSGCVNNAPPLRPRPSYIGSSRTFYPDRTLLYSQRHLPRPHLTSHTALNVQASAGPDAPQEQSRFGLGGPGTWFGFGKRQERAVGRLAMVGFVAGVVMEVLTGKGILAQLGIDAVAVKFPFLAGLSFLFFGGLLGGYVVINNPPDFDKVPPNEGAGMPRDPLKTFDPQNIDPLTTWTRGKKGQEPYASDLDLPPSGKKD